MKKITREQLKKQIDKLLDKGCPIFINTDRQVGECLNAKNILPSYILNKSIVIEVEK